MLCVAPASSWNDLRNSPPPPPGFEDVLRMDKLDIEISNWICLKHMFMLAADDKILRLLLSMTPTVIRAPEGEFFLTGDQPRGSL